MTWAHWIGLKTQSETSDKKNTVKGHAGTGTRINVLAKANILPETESVLYPEVYCDILLFNPYLLTIYYLLLTHLIQRYKKVQFKQRH
jgi:hypothetical protein